VLEREKVWLRIMYKKYATRFGVTSLNILIGSQDDWAYPWETINMSLLDKLIAVLEEWGSVTKYAAVGYL